MFSYNRACKVKLSICGGGMHGIKHFQFTIFAYYIQKPLIQNWATPALIVAKINAFILTFKLTKMAKWTTNIFSSFYA